MKNKSEKQYSVRAAYSLAEMLIVLGIISLMSSMAIASFSSSTRTLRFNANYESVLQMVREARSLAVTGKAQKDYTDYDGDDDTTEYMTPAGYGVNFEAGKITLFADLHKSTDDPAQVEGKYVAPVSIGMYEVGKDLILQQTSIDSSKYSIIFNPIGVTTLIFTPLYADAIFDKPLGVGQAFFFFGVKETVASNPIKQCAKIHKIAGIPEAPTSSENTSNCT